MRRLARPKAIVLLACLASSFGCSENDPRELTRIEIVSPAPNSEVSEQTVIQVDVDSALRVDFRLDGEPIGSRSSAPFDFSWNTRADGSGNYTLSATAHGPDNSARDSIELTVNNLGQFFLRVEPSSATLQLEEELQFDAQVLGSSDRNLEWTVEDGDEYGTITPDGLFRAPATLPRPPKAVVRASLRGNDDAAATAEIVFLNLPGSELHSP